MAKVTPSADRSATSPTRPRPTSLSSWRERITTTAKGIAFIVPSDTPGIEVAPWDRKLGNHGSHTAQIFFDGCRIPAANLLGGIEGHGFKNAMAGINVARMHVAATCVGQADRDRDGRDYAKGRVNSAIQSPVQAVQHMLAESYAETLAARSMVLETARQIDAGERPLADMSSCKLFASEMVCRVADRMLQIHGGAGYMGRSTSNGSIGTFASSVSLKAPLKFTR